MPKISVIVPVYNVEGYLSRCLNSLLQQTFQDFELICIDDGSTDGSSDLLKTYQAQYPQQIRIKRTANQGLSGARNEGLSLASGEYICFIDSDDWVHPNLFEQWYHLALQHQADIIACGIEVVSESGKSLYQYGLVDEPLTPESVALQTNEVCNKLYHRRLLEGFEFPLGQWYEDLSTVPILLTRANRIVQWREMGYYYFQRHDSITKTYDDRVLHILLAFRSLKKELDWETSAWHQLLAKHVAYTLIRIASIPVSSKRVNLYRALKQEMGSFMTPSSLSFGSRAEGGNARVLITLWLSEHWILLDVVLQMEVYLRYQLRKWNREFKK